LHQLCWQGLQQAGGQVVGSCLVGSQQQVGAQLSEALSVSNQPGQQGLQDVRGFVHQ
jgi:hypothetical protein